MYCQQEVSNQTEITPYCHKLYSFCEKELSKQATASTSHGLTVCMRTERSTKTHTKHDTENQDADRHKQTQRQEDGRTGERKDRRTEDVKQISAKTRKILWTRILRQFKRKTLRLLENGPVEVRFSTLTQKKSSPQKCKVAKTQEEVIVSQSKSFSDARCRHQKIYDHNPGRTQEVYDPNSLEKTHKV